jgi:HlyD family secretion protein
VKGVIIDRRVNIGQTVVSSLNAPSLFLIAKDLNRMQVWVSVNEADIGSIHPGQPVTFLVDAYSGETFHGEVNKVRLNATMTQNVVTYTVEVTTDNSSGRLLPYLTSTVQFEVNRRNDVMMVPNTALRWMPRPEQVAPEAREAAKAVMERASAGAPGERGAGDRPRRSSTRSTTRPGTRRSAGSESRRGTVWVAEGDFVKPVDVTTGITDGRATEVQGAELVEGAQVVVGEQSSETASAPAGGANPFIPQFRSTRSGTPGGTQQPQTQRRP